MIDRPSKSDQNDASSSWSSEQSQTRTTAVISRLVPILPNELLAISAMLDFVGITLFHRGFFNCIVRRGHGLDRRRVTECGKCHSGFVSQLFSFRNLVCRRSRFLGSTKILKLYSGTSSRSIAFHYEAARTSITCVSNRSRSLRYTKEFETYGQQMHGRRLSVGCTRSFSLSEAFNRYCTI